MDYEEFTEIRAGFESHAKDLTGAWQDTKKPVNAKFPRGYIRPYSELRPRWPYLDPENKTLLCQIIQLCDVNRWNLHVWDLSGTAGGAYVWNSTIPIIAIIEVLCREYSKLKNFELRTKRKCFENYIFALEDNSVINSDFSAELQELRVYRNSIHLTCPKHQL